MAKDVNKRGIEKKQYPKLIRVEGKKILVNSIEEENKYLPSTEIRETTKTKKPASWGK